MGIVHRAYHAALDREVAIKFLHEKYAPGTPLAGIHTRKFVGEARIAARLQHPGIPPVHEVGTLPDGRPFLAMKLIRGKTLAALLKEQGYGGAKWLGVFEAVCQAVGAAHAAGYMHRDLKPQNVMVGAFSEVQVMDWGLAKAVGQQRVTGGVSSSKITNDTVEVVRAGAEEDTDASRGGIVKGTLRYMSPEQARGEVDKTDRRADVFALGAILCELLTGQTPLSGSEEQVFYDCIAERFDMAHARLDGCGEDSALIALAKRCLAAKPESRPSDASEVAAAVSTFRAETETRAKQAELERGKAEVKAAEQLKRQRELAAEQRKRQRVLAVSGGIISGVLLTGLVVSLLFLNRATTAEGQAKLALANEETASEKLLTALDTMVSDITGFSLATQQTITPQQQKLLTEVLPLYHEFASRKGESELSRERIARAAYRLGLIEYRLQRVDEGIAAFEQARDRYVALVAEFPAVPEYRYSLTASHTNMGILLADRGDDKGAEEQYRKGLAIVETLIADFPTVPGYRYGLAICQNRLGILLAGRGDDKGAEEQYRMGLAIREKLAAEFPAKPEYRLDLALIHNNLGLLLADRGDDKGAEEQYRKGLAIVETLIADFPTVPGYRRSLAIIHPNLGLLLAGREDDKGAEEQYRKGLAIQEKLAAEFPAVPEYRSLLAASHNKLGALLARRGDDKGAEERYRKGLVIEEKLAAEFPAVPEYHSLLARIHTNMGGLLADRGDDKGAEEQYRKGLAIREKLAAEFPAMPEYRSLLAASHTDLGLLLADRGDDKGAEEQYRKGLAIEENLAAEFPAVPKYQANLGGSYCNLGILVRDGEREAESLAWFQKAIDTLRPVHDKEPRDVTAKLFLRNSHAGRAKAYDQLGKHADAAKEWDRAMELSDKAKQPWVRAYRATSRLHAGQVAEALAEVAELWKLPGWDADQLYGFACIYAVASAKIVEEKQNYANRAMEMLQKAVKEGYKDATRMKADKDLDPLRDHVDFKKLLAELEKNTSPKK